jgi:hypothetical protein
MWKSALSLWSWTSGTAATLTDYFTLTLDMNTAILKYLNFYYTTSYQDIQRPLARYLAEVPSQDIQNQWQKLLRRARGIST